MLLLALAIIALLIFYKLFKEFGKTQKIIINMREEDREKLKNVIEGVIANSTSGASTDCENAKLDKIYLDLQEKFPDFSPTTFLAKAEEMFDAIFNSFANSHHYILKSMLTEKLYESFASQIARRESKNLRQELLIKHKETSLDEIQILSEKAQIFVTFDVNQMSAMVTSEGISPDNPKRIYRDVIHKWVFERTFGNDSWILSKTSIGTKTREIPEQLVVEDK